LGNIADRLLETDLHRIKLMIWPFATAVAIACEQQGRLAANTGLAACAFARASATAAAGEAAAAAGQVVTLHGYRTGTARLDRGLGFGDVRGKRAHPLLAASSSQIGPACAGQECRSCVKAALDGQPDGSRLVVYTMAAWTG
jgi:hypothetical protein